MPMMTLNRKHRHISIEGNSIAFEKGEPTYIPKNLVKYAVGIGAEFVDAKDDAALHPKNTEEAVIPPAAPTGDERKDRIKEIMLAMRERNDRADFTAAGLPTVPSVSRLAGFDVEMRERNDLWKEVLAELGTAD